MKLDLNKQCMTRAILLVSLLMILGGCGGSAEIAEGADDTTAENNSNSASGSDTDGDGVVDSEDNCPNHVNASQQDSDNDGVGDVCDSSNSSNNNSNNSSNTGNGTDGDGDGVANTSDNCATVANADQRDTDNDGVGDRCDSFNNLSSNEDSDEDGYVDSSDNCPAVYNNPQTDSDDDGYGDACDSTDDNDANEADADYDGVVDAEDNCPNHPNHGQNDVDSDGVGDVCDSTTNGSGTDTDGDGVPDASDNCPNDSNASQSDGDNDGIGDVCDPVDNNSNSNTGGSNDGDGDGVSDNVDNCANIANADQADLDSDGLGDACDSDDDGDGAADTSDNCPAVSNASQSDADSDGIGDACDSFTDSDGDGVADSSDNCPLTANANQADADNDGVGDACQASGDDPYPATVGVKDSFGQVAAPSTTGPQWMAINSYYNDYPPQAGECSKAVHNKYWVEGWDGKYYPTWHPAEDASDCRFGHEHGDDPRGSDLYKESGGIPFGFVHSRLMNSGGMGDRQEDHVGHKVIMRNNWIAVAGNPVNDGHTIKELGTDFECDWLSKVHQGTHSADALGNNQHEYFLNISCADGTHAVIKQLAVWGAPSRVFNECSDNGDAHPSGDPYLHPGLIDVGFDSSDNPPVHAEDPNPENSDATETGWPVNDGKREFGCIKDKVNGYKDLMELWKPDGVMRTPENGSIHFSPYYITKNPTRYVDPDWQEHGLPNGYINTVDLCIRGSLAWEKVILNNHPNFATNGQYPNFCSLNNLSASLQTQWEDEIQAIKDSGASVSEKEAALAAAREARRLSPQNPFDGTKRVTHPKRIQIYNGNGTANTPEGHTRFCTNAWGKSPVWPQSSGDCPSGTIPQVISVGKNNWDTISATLSNGSTVSGISGSSNNSTNLATGAAQDPAVHDEEIVAPGIGEEWLRDESDDVGIHGPN